MYTVSILIFLFSLCMGQIIDIGGVWESSCPHGCSCEIQKFSDLSLHRWTNIYKISSESTENSEINENPFVNDLLKVATCVVADNPEELLAKLPSDLQVFNILETGSGKTNILLPSTAFHRFTDLISLDIQGMDPNDPYKKETKRSGSIVMSADALYFLGETLLYLNLERLKLTSLSSINKNKANLIVKRMNSSHVDISADFPLTANDKKQKGHRLIFLSQQNNGHSEDKEILPYDIYKQEMEGYKENMGLFTGLNTLTYLRVYDCELSDISWHMFDGLNNLLYLSLENNNLKFIPEFCFYGTPNLKILSLASNQLLTLNSIDLAGLLMLEKLDLRKNNLTFLSELSFPPFPELKIANFQDNPLDSVFPSTFEIMNTTLELYLGGIEAKLKLQKNSLLGLQQLQKLQLYNVEISLLERFILQGMPLLKYLKMQGNISSIDFDAFIDLNKLVDLDLGYCHLKTISMDAFYGLENVKRIDLSYNELEFIPSGLFAVQQQKELSEIILTNNKLTTLPWDFFKNLRLPNKQLKIFNIRLDDNPWDCSCLMTSWYLHLVSKVKETAPRCATPLRLKNWGIFQALRKGGLQCKSLRNRYIRKPLRVIKYKYNNID
ncbi:carboxypeptidase N subunit 2-like isoform X2 [Prorops nasuta]|uniref:carboxypeptidase N subunit 2-like isoform X2 n=1 Tax=Prorops nasuta TaxID=863751 RepID=UPI0034CE7081